VLPNHIPELRQRHCGPLNTRGRAGSSVEEGPFSLQAQMFHFVSRPNRSFADHNGLNDGCAAHYLFRFSASRGTDPSER
jgi:hypothetical protein